MSSPSKAFFQRIAQESGNAMMRYADAMMWLEVLAHEAIDKGGISPFELPMCIIAARLHAAGEPITMQHLIGLLCGPKGHDEGTLKAATFLGVMTRGGHMTGDQLAYEGKPLPKRIGEPGA